MADCIRNVVEEVLRELKGKRYYEKTHDGRVQRFKKPFEREEIATKFGRGLGIQKIMKHKKLSSE